MGHYRPIVELMYADFSLVAADQLFNQIAKSRHMYGGDTAMPIVVRTKMALGTGFGGQHLMDPAGLFANWPGWRIVAPATPFDYVGLMNSALHCQDPVLVIEHVDLYNTSGPGTDDDYDYYIPLGKAKIVQPGTAFTVLAYSKAVHMSLNTAQDMGVDAEIIDLRSLDRAGIDWETIEESVKKTNHVLIVENGTQTTSYGQILADEVQRRLFDYLDHPVRRVCGGEASPSVSKVLEKAALVSEEDIRNKYEHMVNDSD